MTVHAVFSNEKPFSGAQDAELLKRRIQAGERPDLSKVPEVYRDLVQQCTVHGWMDEWVSLFMDDCCQTQASAFAIST